MKVKKSIILLTIILTIIIIYQIDSNYKVEALPNSFISIIGGDNIIDGDLTTLGNEILVTSTNNLKNLKVIGMVDLGHPQVVRPQARVTQTTDNNGQFQVFLEVLTDDHRWIKLDVDGGNSNFGRIINLESVYGYPIQYIRVTVSNPFGVSPDTIWQVNEIYDGLKTL